MSKIRRVANKDDNIVKVTSPVSSEELKERQELYDVLPPSKFAKRLIDSWTQTVTIEYQEKKIPIQMNFCSNPFCRWFAQTQLEYSSFPYKPSRYQLKGAREDKKIECIADPTGLKSIPVFVGEQTTVYSNWGIADEISRLIRVNSTVEITPNYRFHDEGCPYAGSTPFDSRKNFQKFGKDESGSQRWKCKKCPKFTNVLPERHERHTFNQKRSDVTLKIANQLINKSGVRATIRITGIGHGTYYKKIDYIYQRCLEFLERHETEKLQKLTLQSIWINTDQLQYYLNNTKKKGFGSVSLDDDDLHLQTHVIASVDSRSRYVFRADVAYDWEYSAAELEGHTYEHKEDHLPLYARKNARLKFSASPAPPSTNDTQSQLDYEQEVSYYKEYTAILNGIHTDITYTAIAHYWLLKRLLKTEKWNIVTDNDGALRTAFYKVFAKEVLDGYVHHFLYKIDTTKKDAAINAEYMNSTQRLKEWAMANGILVPEKGLYQIARLWLAAELKRNPLYDFKEEDGNKWPYYADRLVKHPIATNDQGYRYIGCTTDLTHLNPEDMAKKLLKVDNAAIDAFFQSIRRRISILERPIGFVNAKVDHLC